ncbi:MAG: hypothetical protein ACRD4B_06785, partial [Acidobacteriota bacterium]
KSILRRKVMRKFLLALLVSSFVVSGVAIAQQSGKPEQSSSMQGMMGEMKSGKEGEHKDGMMRMMKMMDQCSAMMKSAATDAGPAKESPKQ